jgi:divinyl chlorophyllide a 8-vinyl-reductase
MTRDLGPPARTQASSRRRIMLLGATGTIGGATAAALIDCGHDVVCFVRPTPSGRRPVAAGPLSGTTLRYGDITDPQALARDGFGGDRFDALISCLASRTGAPADAKAIDHIAHTCALAAARSAGVSHFVLLSAICVQKPLLAFQHAKLAFENELIASGLTYSIVRPTAYFKSLSGQIERLKRGKPFLMFGDGKLTASKPISDPDLGRYLASCLDTPSCINRILPIGGPGAAITPLEQGEMLFELLGREPKFKRVPVKMLDAIVATLATLGRVAKPFANKAELARIGRYYATESMLVINPATGRYDAEATPSFGTETLRDYYRRLIAGEVTLDRGDHAVF